MTLILQNDESDCLLACYAMILDDLGSRVMLADLQCYRKDRRRGTSLGELQQANEDFGVTMSAVRSEGKPNLGAVRGEIRTPVIAHLKRGHFVVITSIGRNTVRLNDPAFGPAEMDIEEFSGVSSGVFISFARSEDFVLRATRPHPFSLFRNLSKKTIGLLVLAVFLAQLVTLGMSSLSKAILDNSISGPFQIGLVLLALAVAIVLSTEVQRRSAHRGVDDFENTVSRRLFQGLSAKDMMWVKNRGTGKVVELLSLRNQIRDILLQDLAPTVVSIMTLVPVFAYMAVIDVTMAVLLGVAFIVYLMVLIRLSLKRFFQYQGYVFGQVEMSGKVASDLDRWKEVTVRRDNFEVAQSWFDRSLMLSRSYKNCLSIDRNIQIATQFFSVGSSVVAVGLGAVLIQNNSMSLGDLVIIQLLNGLLTSAAGTIQSGVLSARNLSTFFYSLLDITQGESAADAISENGKAVEPSDTLIEGVNLEAIRGQNVIVSPTDVSVCTGKTIEISGPSGSGKTTLIDSMLGILPSKGELSFSRDLDFKKIGISSPDINFRPSGLRDFLDPDTKMSDQELSNILWSVGLEDVVSIFDMNTAPATFVSALSTGQMQRLVLARSLVLGEQIVVWDEPFGTLDEGTAKLIIERVFQSKRYSERAFIIVTHQHFSNLNVDNLVVLS